MEYIRDVYAELVAMGEGARRPGDRSDISSDEEDELEVSYARLPFVLMRSMSSPNVVLILQNTSPRCDVCEVNRFTYL